MTSSLFIAFLTVFAGAEPLRPGYHLRDLEHDDLKRAYLLHIPKNYDATKPTPVVLALHGANMNGGAMAWLTGLNETGDKHNFITVFPSGTGAGILLHWNAGGFPGGLFKTKVDDVGYLGKVLDDVEKVANVD